MQLVTGIAPKPWLSENMLPNIKHAKIDGRWTLRKSESPDDKIAQVNLIRITKFINLLCTVLRSIMIHGDFPCAVYLSRSLWFNIMNVKIFKCRWFKNAAILFILGQSQQRIRPKTEQVIIQQIAWRGFLTTIFCRMLFNKIYHLEYKQFDNNIISSDQRANLKMKSYKSLPYQASSAKFYRQDLLHFKANFKIDGRLLATVMVKLKGGSLVSQTLNILYIYSQWKFITIMMLEEMSENFRSSRWKLNPWHAFEVYLTMTQRARKRHNKLMNIWEIWLFHNFCGIWGIYTGTHDNYHSIRWKLCVRAKYIDRYSFRGGQGE